MKYDSNRTRRNEKIKSKGISRKGAKLAKKDVILVLNRDLTIPFALFAPLRENYFRF
jgi:hypothetical protein